MDLHQTALFFDNQHFDEFDFSTQGWRLCAAKGQLKRGDQFLSIYHLPTRKDMAFFGPEVDLKSTVIRTTNTHEVFMLGSLQQDTANDREYRRIWSMHKPSGRAHIFRRYPEGPSTDPGHAVSRQAASTWGDVEFRSVNEDVERHLYPDSHVTLALPARTDLRRWDVVRLNGAEYTVITPFVQAGYTAARAVQQKDPRLDLLFRSKTGDTYVPGGIAGPSYADFDVTAYVSPAGVEEVGTTDLLKDTIKVMIPIAFIGVRPKPDDLIVYLGHPYKVVRVDLDAGQEEWNLLGRR